MGLIFHGKMVIGTKFYGILVQWWAKNFRLGPFFHGILVPRTKIPWKIDPPEQNYMENRSGGPKFHGILVPGWGQKFQARAIFPWNFGPPDQFSPKKLVRGTKIPWKTDPGDQYSMENWSPEPIFSGTNFPVTGLNSKI